MKVIIGSICGGLMIAAAGAIGGIICAIAAIAAEGEYLNH